MTGESVANRIARSRPANGQFMTRLPSPGLFQAGQRARASAELVRLDAQPLQHADEEVAQGRVLLVESEVLAVLEAAAGEQDGEVLDGVAAAVAEVAAQEN